MEKYEKFISKPENLEEVMQTIQEQEIPEKFDRFFLSSLGIMKPNSVLYVQLFKNLGLVTEEGYPHPTYYSQLIESEEQAKKCIARQLKNTLI